MVTLAEIKSADWSLKLGGIGEVAQGVDDVSQCLIIILSTRRGSDLLRPTFGADLWQYIDKPISEATPAIVRDATEAITRWEPRIQLVSIAPTIIIDGTSQTGAKLSLDIVWNLKLAAARANKTTVVLGKGGARA